MNSVLKNGNRGANGGKRPGAGRPTDEFKKKCQKVSDSPKFFAWIKDIVDGKIDVDPETRIKAWNTMTDRAVGKAVQAIEHSGGIDIDAENAKSLVAQETKKYLGALIASA